MANKILDPHFWSLESVFKSVYSVPVYQRPYSWDIEQVEVLINDIFEAYRSEEKFEGYFTGNIIVHDNGNKINGIINHFEIIDGQQRLTTFSLLMLSLYIISLNKGYNSDDKTVSNVKESLWKYINRKYEKEYRTISLNSIEKKCFSDLFDYCFSANKETNIEEYYKNYKCLSKFDKRVMDNFNFIYLRMKKQFDKDNDEVLNFSDYLLQYIQFIVIESSCKQNKVFSMFESINSKGKRLEEIDLIKTFIFSNLDIDSYKTYLDKWGQLIISTNDNLYDYLYIYIKAYLCFYRQNISIVNFKSICKKELLVYFGETKICNALKKLLDDLYNKVDYYNMLFSTEKAYQLVKSTKFRFYYKVFIEMSYKHPKPLFFRSLIEFSNGKLEKNAIIDIVVETIKFMIKFLAISNRPSKDVINMFSNILNDIYFYQKIDKEAVIYAIASEELKQGITVEKMKSDLQSMDCFEENKKLAVSLLSLYDSSENNDDGTIKISFDQAYTILNSFSTTFSLDHLLVQTPTQDFKEFGYFCDNNNKLVLSETNDFPKNIVVNGMDYDMFTHVVLNKIGNLRIYYRDKNSTRNNDSIELREYEKFNKYDDIIKRGNAVVKMLCDNILKSPDVDLSKTDIVSLKKAEANLPKMDKLIEYGIISPGVKIYITTAPETSIATLIDDKYVLYNEKQMTLNEWGCLVTGWKSIRIYAYAAIVGEIDTLHKKRLDYLQNHNEEIDINGE